MGLTLVFDRYDSQPLGSIAEVQSELERIFPGVRFAVQHKLLNPTVRVPQQSVGIVVSKKPGLMNWIVYQIMRRITPPLKYPYVAGDFHGDGFAIQFEFGSDAVTTRLPITLYGAIGNFDPYFERLGVETGWQIRRLRFRDLFADRQR